MKYSIAFKGLPFVPERNQVIYVESRYDERINTFIKDHYARLKSNFKRADLDFVYLPMFFDDEEIKEKVLYYAPYLTSEIIEKTELMDKTSSKRGAYLYRFNNRAYKDAPNFKI